MRPDWDEWGLSVARAVSGRADCTRRQVGAVIADRNHRIVGTGYNGAPPGERGCLDGGCPRGLLSYQELKPYSGYENCISNHAEVNALLFADRSKVEGGTLYVTDAPCFGCCKVIANSGIKYVVWPDREGRPQRETVGKLPLHA